MDRLQLNETRRLCLESEFHSMPAIMAPTQSLPPLARLPTHSTDQIRSALWSLRRIYFPRSILASKFKSEVQRQGEQPIKATTLTALCLPKRNIKRHIHDTPIPDSGYASAEENEDEPACDEDEGDLEYDSEPNSETATDLTLLRSEPHERIFAINWVTGFVARSDAWIACASPDCDAEADVGPDPEGARTEILDEAVALLSLFNGTRDEEEDDSLTRKFVFSLGAGLGYFGYTDLVPSLWPLEGNHSSEPLPDPRPTQIQVELNDAPLLKEDHTSVGLQSWGSCILFAERMCLDPTAFSLFPPASGSTPSSHFQPPSISDWKPRQGQLRILELGAGTGMLSIVSAKILQAHSYSKDLGLDVVNAEIVATDYHPDVLLNLAENVKNNFPPSSSSKDSSTTITITHLDWSQPKYTHPAFDEPFDIVLAADVVYHPQHAKWLKGVVERVLRRPLTSCQDGTEGGGTFWLFMPIRTTGRHEGMVETVEQLFPSLLDLDLTEKVLDGGDSDSTLGPLEYNLAILHQEDVARQVGVGRMDEGAYRLFKIGWF